MFKNHAFYQLPVFVILAGSGPAVLDYTAVLAAAYAACGQLRFLHELDTGIHSPDFADDTIQLALGKSSPAQ